jgi:hypothetical protein
MKHEHRKKHFLSATGTFAAASISVNISRDTTAILREPQKTEFCNIACVEQVSTDHP